MKRLSLYRISRCLKVNSTKVRFVGLYYTTRCKLSIDHSVDWTVHDSNLIMDKIYSSAPKRPNGLCGTPSLLFSRYPGSFLEVKRSGREVNHSPPSSADVKNEWSCTSAPPVCLRGMDRSKFPRICATDLPYRDIDNF